MYIRLICDLTHIFLTVTKQLNPSGLDGELYIIYKGLRIDAFSLFFSRVYTISSVCD